jgi:hypothetical protein
VKLKKLVNKILLKFFKSNRVFKNKINGVIFDEIMDLGNESLMMRTDIGIRRLIPKRELEKNYTLLK